MRFIRHVNMFGMALGMALSLPCGDNTEIWQDDGYGGQILTVNPDCYKKRVTNTSPTPVLGSPNVITPVPVPRPVRSAECITVIEKEKGANKRIH